MKYTFLGIAVMLFGYCNHAEPELKKIATDLVAEKLITENLAFDIEGDSLNGGKRYSLHLAAGLPADSWSATAYDLSTSSIPPEGQVFSSLKMTEPLNNSDGSVDLYFGPTTPAGKEKNWLRTVKGRKYFVIIRFYNPKKEFFDKAWKSGGIRKLK
jgi:hypothetical protein